MIKQHRREQITLHMSPYNSNAGQGLKAAGQTLSGLGQTLAKVGQAAGTLGQYEEHRQKMIEDEEAKAAGKTGRGGGLTDEAQAKLADAQLNAFQELQAVNNRIREKYRDNPDGEKMNEELRSAFDAINEKYTGEVDSAAVKTFRNSMNSNMKELIRANYSDARSRKAAIAAKKEKDLKKYVNDAQQKAIYNAGRQGQPIEEVAARVIPKELQENPNMPVDAETKKQVEAIPAMYISGQIDKPAYDTYDEEGNLETQGIVPEEKIHAPVNFDKVIDDYYDNIEQNIDELPGLSDKQKKEFKDKANYARDNKKQDFARYIGEYKRGATADFIKDPQSDMMDSALFHEMPDGYVEPEITQEMLQPYLDEGYSEDEAIEYIQHGDPLGAETDSGTEPKIQWEEKPIKKEMQRLADNAYKSSEATTPRVDSASMVVHKMQIPDALDETEMEQQSETALKNVNDVLEDPLTTNEEREAARTIVANALEDPETRAKTNELFAKAQILDLYRSLFDEAPETDLYPEIELELMDKNMGQTGLSGVEFQPNADNQKARDEKDDATYERLFDDVASGKVKRHWVFDVNTEYGKFSPKSVKAIENALVEEDKAVAEIKRVDVNMTMRNMTKDQALDYVYKQNPEFWQDKEMVERVYDESKDDDRGLMYETVRDLSMAMARDKFKAYYLAGDKTRYFNAGKKGEPSFDFNKASERNRQKYKLVRDTYLGVMQMAKNKDFDGANALIESLPYNVAKINYGGQLSPELIDRFHIIDQSGKQEVAPQFMYRGYSFEYLGMDKTGTILARRKL